MPYISKEWRGKINPTLQPLLDVLDNIPNSEYDGMLNYIISRIVARALGPRTGEWRYKDIARADAVFSCAAKEFYRRVAAPKEDAAIAQNGDIPEYAKKSDVTPRIDAQLAALNVRLAPEKSKIVASPLPAGGCTLSPKQTERYNGLLDAVNRFVANV